MSTNPNPATSHALSLPEILSIIFSSFGTNHKDLRNCTLVNQLWNQESAPYLWKSPTLVRNKHVYGHFLMDILERVAPSRRQYYANIIETAAVESTCGQLQTHQHDEMLEDLVFPRLKRLIIFVVVGAYCVPRIQAPGLVTLEIDPQHEVYSGTYVDYPQLDIVLEQVPAWFPGIKEIRFVDFAHVTMQALERLGFNLPFVDGIDASRLSVVEDD